MSMPLLKLSIALNALLFLTLAPLASLAEEPATYELAAPLAYRCAMLGDSIALGASTHASRCLALARQGITSRDWLSTYGRSVIRAETAVISLGTNDGDALATRNLLIAIRSRILAKRVMWIAPGPQFPARAIVIDVGKAFGDVVYERPIENLASDRIHFDQRGYARIAALVQQASPPP